MKTLLLQLLLGAVIGIALGTAFFGALAWTVAQLRHAARPGALLAVSLLALSLLARMLLALITLAVAARAVGAAGLLAALAAFVAVRQAFLLRARGA